ncbi:winged helix-turn-helix domain-containing protein [Olivibacter sp. SDN3]|uniref:winged helix-turn-helix domain-containing protein n=1 Tax=Olivibacter sp. SDN3 TaxID=2764720 RepID=UPI00351B9FF9
MSYKKAWEIVNRLNEVTGHPFVLTNAGGEHGGGSFISNKAKETINNYLALQEKLRQFLEKEQIDIHI